MRWVYAPDTTFVRPASGRVNIYSRSAPCAWRYCRDVDGVYPDVYQPINLSKFEALAEQPNDKHVADARMKSPCASATLKRRMRCMPVRRCLPNVPLMHLVAVIRSPTLQRWRSSWWPRAEVIRPRRPPDQLRWGKIRKWLFHELKLLHRRQHTVRKRFPPRGSK